MLQIRVREIRSLQLGKPEVRTLQIPVGKVRARKMRTIGVRTAEKEIVREIFRIPAVPLRKVH